jgi:DNA-binding MarR family transcriptional regulator
MAKLDKGIRPKKRPAQQTLKQKAKAPRNAVPQQAERDPHQIFSLVPTISIPELLDDDGKTDRRFRQMLYDFSVLSSQMDYARAHLASQVNLSSPQYNIGMIIAYYQGEAGVSVSEVAEHLHVTTAFITSEVGKLEKMGLVDKSQNPNDGRGIQLRLTPAGSESLQEIGPQRLLINNHLFRGLSGEDFRRLSKILADLIDEFSETISMLKAMRKTRSFRMEGLTSKRK